MTSTTVMFLGILVMLVGLALDSLSARLVTARSIGLDTATNLAYIEVAVFVIGFVVGLVGLCRR